ncbi:TonB-dependent siderophore receptor [Scytonema sp. UIC 10036]|uniref:TonB-dependent siderophore receptor n=1 Tax=Scytonema sp. UIC 10036 TaxID=2304196 RepID=UPI0012DA95B1|nr:TonB-dependent siderophore receptor [Scytonema sp. UIC 10036]MUG92216.1 TonB-dependent siderophore receptor [Scytonema sp. UIC 10036]
MNQLHLLKNLGLAVVIVAIANRQVLAGDNIAKTNNRAESFVPITQIRRLSHIEHPYKSVKEWVIAQQQAPTSQIIQVTGVRLKPTQSGLEVILETSISDKLQTTLKSEGNTLTALIPNAQLQLASGNFLRSEKPIAGIAEVTIKNQDANSILLTITGETNSPKVELYDSDEGFILAVIASASSAQKPTPSPSPPIERDEEESPQPSSETPPSKPSASGEEPIELVVTGEQDGYRRSTATAGTRIEVPLRDLPLSIQVVPQQVLRDRGLTRVEDAIDNVSGVRRFVGFPFSTGYRVRGFARGYRNLRNGLPDESTHGFANVDRIEVLKGPASVLYGGNIPFSGVINTITKKPLDDPFYEIGFQVGSYDLYRPTLDFGGPLTNDRSVTYRLNASFEYSNSFVDFLYNRDYFIAPAITWRISPQTTLSLEYEYYQTTNRLFSAGYGGSISAQPEYLDLPRSRNFSEPDLSPSTTVTNWISYNFEHRFSDNWKIRQGFAALISDIDIGAERISGVLQRDRRTLNRTSIRGPQKNELYTLQNDLIGTFNTGSVKHNLLFGVQLSKFSYPFEREDARLAPLNIFNPVYGARPGNYTLTTDSENRDSSVGVYLQDFIELAPNLKLLAGIRFDSAHLFSVNRLPEPDVRREQTDTKFSPRVGIVYQPTDSTSVYFNYAQGFFPVRGLSRTGDTFQPEIGEQFEFGVKQDFGEQLSATLALYQITRQNVLTRDPEDPTGTFNIPTGEQQSRGVELDIVGEILPGWNIIAAYAYTDAKVTKDNRIPVGRRLPGVPYNSASLWTTYKLQSGNLKGLGFGLGLTYADEVAVNLVENQFDAPSYLRTDAAIFYNTDNIRVGLNFNNITNAKYFDTDNSSIVPKAPFTVLGSVIVQF